MRRPTNEEIRETRRRLQRRYSGGLWGGLKGLVTGRREFTLHDERGHFVGVGTDYRF
ncbi:MAG TPA: hypothetical protein VMZ92_09225 [Planctomycetota bacterium]|nr:hypothetical protein [Planctomycetota bacterium]